MNIIVKKLTSALTAKFLAPPFVRLARATNHIRLSVNEIFYIAGVIKRKSPCRLLVFGAGNDSCLWTKLNKRGETIFIEDDPSWLDQLRKQNLHCRGWLVEYGTVRTQWQELIEAPDRLRIKLPEEVARMNYDCILIDGPCGWADTQPGRMKSIFEASRLIGPHGDIFVHDCDREIEKAYCDRYLTHGILKREFAQLRHYSFG